MSDDRGATPAFYDRYWASQHDGKPSDFEHKWPALEPLIPREPGVVILDYGCGNGEILRELRALNAGARFIGVDVSEAALATARAAVSEATYHHVRDGERVPLPAASVDFIFSSEVIEHVYDTDVIFAEFARLLRPGGRILITTPYHGLIKNLLLVSFAFDRHFNPRGAHVRFFSKHSLFSALRAVGLEPEVHGYYGRFYPISMGIYVLARSASAGLRPDEPGRGGAAPLAR